MVKNSFRKIPFIQPVLRWDEALFSTLLWMAQGERYSTLLKKRVLELSGARFGLTVNMGRSAIELALRTLELPSEAQVLAPTFACTGVIQPILQAGYRPVLFDVDDNYNPDPQSVEAAITPYARAIIIPHLSGKLANLDALIPLAQAHNLVVIEDACQAFGLKWGGKWTGTIGDVGIFSFGLGKNICGSGGGMLITDREDVAKQLRDVVLPREDPAQVQERGQRFFKRYAAVSKGRWGEEIAKGFSRLRRTGGRGKRFVRRQIFQSAEQSPPEMKLSTSVPPDFSYTIQVMSELDAYIALCQVNRFEHINSAQIQNAMKMSQALSDAIQSEKIRVLEASKNIFTKYLITFLNGQHVRDPFWEFLSQNGVEGESSYTPLHLREPFRNLRRTEMSRSESVFRNVLAIPVHPFVGEGEVEHIAKTVIRFADQL